MYFSRITILWLSLPLALAAQRFFPDDPMWKEPPPMHVDDATVREMNVYVELFSNTFSSPGERHSKNGHIAALGVNTLGEAPDSAWYTNRHYRKRMSIEELVRGAGNEQPPAEGTWRVVAGKAEGITPGFQIVDGAGRRFLLKLDPPNNLEMASGAEVVASKFFHALGYNVPENYVVYFERSRLELAPGAMLRDRAGKQTPMSALHIDGILDNAPRDEVKGYRAVASLFLEGKLLGPYQLRGARSDDPNDIAPHEHRRDLRGLYVPSAWLGHHDFKESNTLDVLVGEGNRRYVKHYLVDFNAALGSDSIEAKRPRDGYEYLFAWRPSVKRALTLGIWTPGWAKADFPAYPAVGRFEYELFEPEQWRPRSPLPPFSNCLADDAFWAAKQVMAFTDEEIRAIVKTGLYSSAESVEWLVKCLIERRDKVGREYFSQVLPLDRFRVENGRLEFDDLAADHGLRGATQYNITWSRFDNTTERHAAIDGSSGPELPVRANGAGDGSAYYAARISGEEESKTVTVYVRKGERGFEVVGVERGW